MIVETNLPDLKIKINQIIPFWKSKVTVISAKLPDGGRCPPYNVALDAINATEQFILGFDFAAFQDDQKTIFAVARAVQIVGEASKQIPLEIRDAYPSIPWKEIAGMRDKMIHHYFGINLKILWNTAQKDFPQLKQKIQQILDDIQ